MRMRLLPFLLLLLAPSAYGQYTVTGHVALPSGTAPSNVKVCLTLGNFSPNVPRVINTGTLVAVKNFCIQPAADGSFSTTLFGNDSITPVSTNWRVDFLINGQQQSSATYFVNHTPFNLDTEVPLSVSIPAGPNQLITQAFPFTQVSAATTWTIIHNFNDPNVFVQVFDTNHKVIYPDGTDTSNPNQAVLTFVTAQAGFAIAMHAGAVNIATTQPNAVVQNPVGSQTIAGSQLTVQGGFTATLNGLTYLDVSNPNNYIGIFSRIRCVRPAPDAPQYPLGHDCVLEADGSADIRLVNGAAQVTATTTLTGGGGAQVITVTTPVLTSTAFGSVALTGNPTALFFCDSAVDVGCQIIIDPDTANQEIIPYVRSSGTTLTVTPALSHTQPFTIRQVGGIDLDTRNVGINRADVSDRPLVLMDRGGSPIMSITNDTAGTTKPGVAFNAFITGDNGANKNTRFWHTKAASCEQWFNFAKNAVTMQLCEVSGGPQLQFSNPTNTPFVLDGSGTDLTRFTFGGSIAGAIWYTNALSGNCGIIHLRNNSVNDLEKLTFDGCNGNLTSVGQLISSVATGTAPLSISSTTPVANLTVQNCSTCVITGASSGSGIQGTDTKLLTSGTISGTGVPLCTSANGGATTSGCPPAVIQVVRKTSTSCTTGSSTFAQCSETLNWPSTFADNSYSVTCSGVAPSDARAYLQIASHSTTQVVLTVETIGSVAVNWGEIDCTGVHP